MHDRHKLIKCEAGASLRQGNARECAVCASGPIHPFTSPCTCRAVRGAFLVCRKCAIAIDLIKNGFSKFTDAPFTPDEMRQLAEMAQRADSYDELVASQRWLHAGGHDTIVPRQQGGPG